MDTRRTSRGHRLGSVGASAKEEFDGEADEEDAEEGADATGQA
jgi:hypothetical protein